ncbi:MAG: fimbria/pilus outer membrane usher protein [Pseudomonadota bacterium]|nr:fimbria/pilus outer membrane usher protein [Pseudomonadota bacterium]
MVQLIWAKPVNLPPQKQAPILTAPISVNNTPVSQIKVLGIDGPEANVNLEGAHILEIMNWYVKDEVFIKIKAFTRGTGVVTIGELRSVGVVASFSPETLAVVIVVPPAIRKSQDIDFQSRFRPENYLTPAWFSGYTNFNVSRFFDTDDLAGKGQHAESDPTRGKVENILNIGSVILQTEANYVEHTQHPWLRGNFRLIDDIERFSVRTIVGDFDFPLDLFQNSVAMGGVLVFREFSIDPFVVPYPKSETEFFLETPSTVQVFVNGRFSQTLNLPAGRHNLRGLPVQQGVNDIRLVITDQFGKVKTLNFPFITDFELLEKGFNRFAYGYGKQRNLVGPKFEYKDEAGSFYHHYGLTKNITVGVNGQASKQQSVYGLRFYYGTPIGLFGLNSAYSKIDNVGNDDAFSLRYRTLSDPKSIFRLQATYLGRNFESLGAVSPNNPYNLTLQSSWTKYVTDTVSLSIGGGYEYERLKRGDRKSYYALATKRFASNLDMSAQYSEFRDEFLESTDHRIFFTLQWTDSSYNNSVFVTHDTQADLTHALWAYNPGQEVGRPLFNAQVQDSPTTRDYSVGAGYVGYRGIIDAEQRKSDSKPGSPSPNRDRTRLSLGTGLAYTTKGIGFTRPVTDSFVLVRPKGVLKSHRVEVNPSDRNPRAVADFWGPAIIPDLQPYYIESIFLQTDDPLASSLLAENTFRVRPTYKSGVGISIEGEVSVMLSGKLVPATKDVNKWSLKTGVLRPLSGKQKLPIEFFTNRDAEFYVDSVPAGTYELQLDEQAQKVVIKIPEKLGPYDIGKIKY